MHELQLSLPLPLHNCLGEGLEGFLQKNKQQPMIANICAAPYVATMMCSQGPYALSLTLKSRSKMT